MDTAATSSVKATAAKPNFIAILLNILAPGGLALLTAAVLMLIRGLVLGAQTEDAYTTFFAGFLLFSPIFGVAMNLLPQIAPKRFAYFRPARIAIDVFLVLWTITAIMSFLIAYNEKVFRISQAAILLLVALGVAAIGLMDRRNAPAKS